MKIQINKRLFAWDCLEDSPTLKTIKQLLDILPDEKLLESLIQARGKGRDDCPVQVLWRTIVLSVALRHPTIEHCLAELRRNESLRRLIGIESEDRVPAKWNLSRFLDRLGKPEHLPHLHEVFDSLIQRLGEAVPDLGKDTVGDQIMRIRVLENSRSARSSREFFRRESNRIIIQSVPSRLFVGIA